MTNPDIALIAALSKRCAALYAIALEAFEELCGGLPDEIIQSRLESAIQGEVKHVTDDEAGEQHVRAMLADGNRLVK